MKSWLSGFLCFLLVAGANAQATPGLAGAANPDASSSVETGNRQARFVIKPPAEATLASQMSGRLIRFGFEAGAAFNKGDLLAEFDCAERKAQLNKSRAAMDKARRIAASQKQLRDLKAISDLDYEIAEADLLVAKGDVAMARAQVDQCYISAPYDGRVVRKMANPHEHMQQGKQLLQIVASGTLRIDLLVPSLWLRWLSEGMQFSIHIDELDRSFQAKVTGLGARIDAASQTINVRAEIIEPDAALLPGMSGVADFGGL